MSEITMQGGLRSIAERLLSIGNMLDEAGKAPDDDQMGKLRTLVTELSAVLDKYPEPAAKADKGKLRGIAEQMLATASKLAGEPPDKKAMSALKGLLQEFGSALERYPSPKAKACAPNGEKKPKKEGEADPEADKAKDTETEKAKKPDKPEDEMNMEGKEKAKPKPGEEEEPYPQGKPKAEKEGPADPFAGLASTISDLSKAVEAFKGSMDPKADKPEEKGEPTQKNNDAWPLDMNTGRKLSEAEAWGGSKIEKAAQDDNSFGTDPEECRR
jgi:hypothetical protein